MIPQGKLISQIVPGICIGWSLVLVYTAGFGAFHPSVQGILFFAQIALILCFLFTPIWKGCPSNVWTSLIDTFLILLSIISCTYVLFRYEFWMANPASANTLDIFLGSILLVLILEASRRSVGTVITTLALMLIAYALLGDGIPGSYGHRGYSFSRIIEMLYSSGQGFSGLVVYIVSTMVAIFIIVGAVLLSTGTGQVLIDVAKIAAGRLHGGAALMAVMSSALFSTISGSGPANVATTGTFTIPMMKRLNYRPEFAAAVESVASTGGQIMPPIMGAGAFIMAEMLGKAYLSICIAAALPAILYFLGVGWGVYFEALRINLPRAPKEDIPKIREVLSWSRLGPLISFVTVLIFFMVKGHTPQFACFWAFVSFAFLYVFTTGNRGYSNIISRARVVLDGLKESSRMLMNIAVIILSVQIIISMVSLTGLGIKFSETILSIAGTSVLLSLILSSVLIMVLGMGVPTTAAYLIGISVLGTGLLSLGLNEVGIHLFIFYFACISLITPPVCIAVYIAASIAETPWLKAGLVATRLAAAAYIVPFMFVFNPVLLMSGNLVQIILSSVSAIIGVIVLASGTMGFFILRTTIPERLLLIIAAVSLIKPGIITDTIGIGLIIVVLIKQVINMKRYKLKNDVVVYDSEG